MINLSCLRINALQNCITNKAIISNYCFAINSLGFHMLPTCCSLLPLKWVVLNCKSCIFKYHKNTLIGKKSSPFMNQVPENMVAILTSKNFNLQILALFVLQASPFQCKLFVCDLGHFSNLGPSKSFQAFFASKSDIYHSRKLTYIIATISTCKPTQPP